MTRLQALLLGLELSAIVWLGVWISGQWIIDKAHERPGSQVVSSAK
jgi:hypothetical protein